ncbi:MAG: endonuclease [Bacteroidales bacterium]|nr:endonuclease [Bacteroidales bacterium]
MKHFSILIFLLGMVQALIAQPPAGYYSNAQGFEGNDLRQALHQIIRNHNRQSYSQLWNHFYATDRKVNGTVWDIYSDIPSPGTPLYEYTFFDNQCVVSGQPEGSCYNREHTFPVSWWGGGTSASDTMYTDLFQIHPVDGWVNSHRSNLPYGVVNGSATTSNGSKKGSNAFVFEGEVFTGTVFEPIDAYKGDLARNYFYMMTRYKSRIEDWSSNTPMLSGDDLAPWAIEMLLQWHESDPVSQKEVDRNTAVYSIQGNRNPFIDYPEFVNLIWGVGFEPEPEEHVSDFTSCTITLNWTDASGQVLPDAYLVRMSDKGFYDIVAPENGVHINDDFWNQNIAYGTQIAIFRGLTANKVYYFKIFSISGSGATSDYKTSGTVPEISITAR